MSNRYPDTFCILPWIHLTVWPTGKVYQCCQVTDAQYEIGSTTDTTLDQLWNADYLTGLRKTMLAGEQHTSCAKCYNVEKTHGESLRTMNNRKFSHEIEDAIIATSSDTGVTSAFTLKYWDFRFSNLCNFKCRMCSPTFSTAWGAENGNYKLISLADHSKTNILEFVETQVDNIEEVFFAGGEPLIMDEHYYVLEMLENYNNTTANITYNTNLSVLRYKNWDITDIWRRWKGKIVVHASIDAIGEIGSYIRTGSKWKTIAKNITDVANIDKTMLHIGCTVQIFNVFELPDLIDYALNNGIPVENINFSSCLTSPAHYSVQTLPTFIKERIISEHNDYVSRLPDSIRPMFIDKFNSLHEFIDGRVDNTTELNKELKRETVMLDTLRNSSYTCLNRIIVQWMDEL